MKTKTPKVETSETVNEFWSERLEDLENRNPIDEEIEMFNPCNVDGQKTFYGMYREIVKVYEGLEHKADLDYDMINSVFAIDKRGDLDLANLRHVIIAMTLMGDQNILKAQLRGDKKTEAEAIAQHKERCALIGSEMES